MKMLMLSSCRVLIVASFVWSLTIVRGQVAVGVAGTTLATNVTRRLPVATGGKEHEEENSHRISGPAALGMVVIPSTKSFEDTCNDLITLLDNNPSIRIFAEIDHAAAAASVGLELSPNKLVIFGNPVLGSPIMFQNQKVGLDLPQKMLVWKEEEQPGRGAGTVYVGYNSVPYLESRYTNPPISGTPQLDTIAGALANLAAGATGVSVEDILQQATTTMTCEQIRFLKKQSTLRTMRSDFDFDTTVNSLKAAIMESPANLALEVDHAANANNNAGIDLSPTTLLVFGNPNLGTPLMQASPTAGIDLPLKMLVWQNHDDGRRQQVMVTTNAPYFLRVRHGLRGVGNQIQALRTATFNFLQAATVDAPP